MGIDSPYIKHIQFQKGCYLDNTEVDNDMYYVASSLITDFGWKYIYSPNTNKVVEHVRKSKDSNFTVFFENNEIKALFIGEFPDAKVHIEAWLEIKSNSIREVEKTFDSVVVSDRAIPSDDYLSVFSNLLSDLGATEEDTISFNNQYSASLKQAKDIQGVNVRHIVGYTASKPVAVASIYFDGDMGALYNVGTLSGNKKLGYGKNISELALNEASKNGVGSIFLQCEPDGYVEKLYRSIGFSPISTEVGFIEIIK